MATPRDVIIVGAGPAGVGIAATLRQIGVQDVLIIDRYEIGASFIRWPAETRFITPSFYSNPFGPIDLNAVTPDSSLATSSGREHPDGKAYAKYLSEVLLDYQIPTLLYSNVDQVTLLGTGDYRLITSTGETLETKILIWATGEFQFPERYVFSGSELCCHYADISSWQDFKPADYVIIGGYESAVDAAINLLNVGCKVKMLTRSAPWSANYISDPSISLSPYSKERLENALDNPNLEIYEDAEVCDVSKTLDPDGGYLINTSDGRGWVCSERPILCTGFQCGGGARQIRPFFEWNDEGYPHLTKEDASTLFNRLYLVGPQVRHQQSIFCFIYKFRQRFSIVAAAVASQLNLPINANDWTWTSNVSNSCCSGDDCAC